VPQSTAASEYDERVWALPATPATADQEDIVAAAADPATGVEIQTRISPDGKMYRAAFVGEVFVDWLCAFYRYDRPAALAVAQGLWRAGKIVTALPAEVEDAPRPVRPETLQAGVDSSSRAAWLAARARYDRWLADRTALNRPLRDDGTFYRFVPDGVPPVRAVAGGKLGKLLTAEGGGGGGDASDESDKAAADQPGGGALVVSPRLGSPRLASPRIHALSSSHSPSTASGGLESPRRVSSGGAWRPRFDSAPVAVASTGAQDSSESGDPDVSSGADSESTVPVGSAPAGPLAASIASSVASRRSNNFRLSRNRRRSQIVDATALRTALSGGGGGSSASLSATEGAAAAGSVQRSEDASSSVESSATSSDATRDPVDTSTSMSSPRTAAAAAAAEASQSSEDSSKKGRELIGFRLQPQRAPRDAELGSVPAKDRSPIEVRLDPVVVGRNTSVGLAEKRLSRSHVTFTIEFARGASKKPLLFATHVGANPAFVVPRPARKGEARPAPEALSKHSARRLRLGDRIQLLEGQYAYEVTPLEYRPSSVKGRVAAKPTSGLALALASASATSSPSHAEEADIHEHIARLVLTVSGDVERTLELTGVTVGDTVGGVKKRVLDEHADLTDGGHAALTLRAGKKVLPDPMSLNDFGDAVKPDKDGRLELNLVVAAATSQPPAAKGPPAGLRLDLTAVSTKGKSSSASAPAAGSGTAPGAPALRLNLAGVPKKGDAAGGGGPPPALKLNLAGVPKKGGDASKGAGGGPPAVKGLSLNLAGVPKKGESSSTKPSSGPPALGGLKLNLAGVPKKGDDGAAGAGAGAGAAKPPGLGGLKLNLAGVAKKGDTSGGSSPRAADGNNDDEAGTSSAAAAADGAPGAASFGADSFGEDGGPSRMPNPERWMMTPAAHEAYLAARAVGKLYHDRDVHILVVQLILALLSARSGVLDDRYADQYPVVHKKLNVPFILHEHVNQPENAPIVPHLVKGALKLGPSAFQIAKLTTVQLFDPTVYVDLARIAAGAFGVVYFGRTLPTTARSMKEIGVTNVAVKLMPMPKSVHDRCVLHDAFTEILVLERFRDDPRLCRLFDYGVDDEHYWVSMKRYTCSVKEWRMRQDAPLRDRLVLYCNVYLQMCEALAALHSQGVVHFDLKGDNFFVDPHEVGASKESLVKVKGHEPNFEVCLGDFGEAMVFSSADDAHTTENRGTEYIRAPEMLMAVARSETKDTYDRRRKHGASLPADVWSIGCALFELLTGQFLFYDGDWGAFFSRVTNAKFELMPQAKRDMVDDDPELIDFFNFVFIRDPVRRPPMADVLKRFAVTRNRLEVKLCGGDEAAAAGRARRAKLEAERAKRAALPTKDPQGARSLYQYSATADKVSRITETLCVGSAVAARNRTSLLDDAAVTHIVNCTTSKNPFPRDFEYLVAPLDAACADEDDPSAALLGCAKAVIKFYEKAVATNGRLFIYSERGTSAGPALAILLLMHVYNLEYEPALQLVKKQRPVTVPHPKFAEALRGIRTTLDWSSTPKGELDLSSCVRCFCGSCRFMLRSTERAVRRCACGGQRRAASPECPGGCSRLLKLVESYYDTPAALVPWVQVESADDVLFAPQPSSLEASPESSELWAVSRCRWCKVTVHAVATDGRIELTDLYEGSSVML